MKRIILAIFVLFGFGGVAKAASEPIEPFMYEAPTELSRLSVVPTPQVGGGHSASLTWILSTDDNSTACTTSANCFQNVYRASGSCTNSFTLLTTTPLGAAVAQFIDSTITPGIWCYGVTFEINGLESSKDTVSVTLQPAPPSGASATTK